MQNESTVTSKGQITIPASVRRQLGLRAGDRVEFRVDRNGAVLRPLRTADPFEEYAGCFAGAHPPTIATIVRDERRKRGRE
jgi:AbrB family looped-hinge helix DNA binding protein